MTHPAHDHHGDPNLAHHFESMDQQRQSAKLGMWVFLVTEILFFGGLFCAYTVYRVNHPEVFIFGHQFLDKTLGAVNTVVLICSSFTMAWAVRAAQLGQRKILQLMLVLTFLCACGFLGIKYVEYSHKWHHGLLWASSYQPDSHVLAEHGIAQEDGTSTEADAALTGTVETAVTETVEPPAAEEVPPSGGEMSTIPAAAVGPSGLATAEGAATDGHDIVEIDPANAKTFFSIYFMMTGLHGIHVLGGMAAMLWLLMLTRRGAFDTGNFTKVDVVGLYWHLVDLIWIYLFLLLYLIH